MRMMYTGLLGEKWAQDSKVFTATQHLSIQCSHCITFFFKNSFCIIQMPVAILLYRARVHLFRIYLWLLSLDACAFDAAPKYFHSIMYFCLCCKDDGFPTGRKTSSLRELFDLPAISPWGSSNGWTSSSLVSMLSLLDRRNDMRYPKPYRKCETFNTSYKSKA